MKKGIDQNLNNKYSKSAKKIRSILYENKQGADSKVSQITGSDNQTQNQVMKYLAIARRLHFLYNFKRSSSLQQAMIKLRQNGRLYKDRYKISIQIIGLIFTQSCIKSKMTAFHRVFTKGLLKKESQRKKKSGLALLNGYIANRNKMSLMQSFLIIRIISQFEDIIKNNSQIMKTQKEQSQQLQDTIPVALRSPLQQLITYDRTSFTSLCVSILKSPLQLEVRRITNKANAKGQNLLFIVLNNHIKAIVDLTQAGTGNGLSNSNSRRSFNQKSSSVMYQQLASQFFQGDQQLNKLIVLNMDLAKAQGAIELGIKYFTNRNYRFRSNKIVQSRVKLLQLILALLRNSNGQNGSNHQIPPLPQLRNKQSSFQQLQVSHVRLIVQELDHKVYQLSTISEQIPQLQTFKRTLDLTMPEHNTYLTKIVNVLIELHHKVNKLISRRPQKLLRQIQQVEQECLIIQTATSQFILKIQSIDETSRLKPIYFDQRTNKSPDHFRKIQKNVVKFSELLIDCIELEAESREKIVQIKALIEVFWNLIAGMEQYEREWKVYKNRQQKSADEQQIIQLLELSLKFVNDKIQKMAQQFEIQRQALIDANSKNSQFLEEDISRMSRQNDEQRALIQQLERENEILRGELNGLSTYQLKYKQLLRKYDNDMEDLRAKISLLQKREKNYKDKIESLQSQNEQKKVMITNITNDLKRVMKQSEQSWRFQQKNRDLQELLDKLNPQIQDLEKQIRNLKQENTILQRDKDQSQRNNDLIIKKLDEANRRITDLQNQIDSLKHRFEREKTNMREEIEELDRKNKRLTSQFSSNYQTKSKQVERRQIQHRQSLAKKDEKITELNDKIIDLNSKLNQILGKYKNVQYELKRKQLNLEDLTSKIKQHEKNNSTQMKDLIKNYQLSQRQLNSALLQIETIRNRTVPDLEAEIKRRDVIIADLQNFINDLEQKQKILIVQEQNMKRQYDEQELRQRSKQQNLSQKIRQLEAALRQKDVKIRQLQYNINIGTSKINQLESQLRIGSQDKNKLNKELSRIKDLETQNNKLRFDHDKKIRQIELENSRAKSQYERNISDLQRKISDLERQILRLKQSQSQKADFNLKIQSLESSLNDKNKHVSDLQRQILRLKQGQSQKLDLNSKIQSLESTLNDRNRHISDLQRQISRLKLGQSQNTNLNLRMQSLQSSINDKNGHISQLQTKIRALQNSIKEQQRQLERTKNLTDQLRARQREISALKQQKSTLMALKNNQDKIKLLIKQIDYLKQKIRSLEDLIDIFNEQYANLQARIKSGRSKLSTNSSINDKLQQDYAKIIGDFQRLSQQHSRISALLKVKDQQIEGLGRKLKQADDRYNSPINKKLFEQSASKQKLDQTQRQMKILRDRLMLTQNKLNQDSKGWSFRQRDYLQQIRVLKLQLSNLQARFHQSHSTRKQGEQYYLRIEGEKLEQLIRRMETGSSRVNQKLDQILSNSRRVETSGETIDLQSLVEQNRTLVQQIRRIMRQKQQLSTIVKDYPNPDFLTQYAFRIITYFSQIHPESIEAKSVWEQLLRIRKQNAGEKYFIILEQFTKFTLQQCALEIYRRQLKQKSLELQLLKNRLNAVIQQTLASQKIVYEKTALTQSRVMMFREKFVVSENRK